MRKYNVLERLKKQLEGNAAAHQREAAMLFYTACFDLLGAKLEPYVSQILPQLLGCFGDSSGDVRTATTDACRAIMRSLTPHGVKMVLPLILSSLADGKDTKAANWRQKTESISLLAAMSNLSPAALGMSLPQIVPRLIDCLSDPHPKVNEATKCVHIQMLKFSSFRFSQTCSSTDRWCGAKS